MDGAHRQSSPSPDEFPVDLTRPPAPIEGELPYESTVTAPTEWVPYVYTDTETLRIVSRRKLSVASLACGTLGLLLAIFGVWGVALSLGAVVLALIARTTERAARTLSTYGLISGLAGFIIALGWFIYITQVLQRQG